MAELSGYFTTAATAVGTDQQVSYTQTHDAIATRVIAACHGFEGVAPAYLNSLSATATAANTVSVDTGGAIVDGKWFVNDAAQDVTIASAGAGLTRIDRIVLRCNWAAWNVSVYTVTGTDHATPTAPTITQTSGTTYDILLWQALVNDAGAVTLTDERTWARISVGEIDKFTTCAVLGRYTNSTGDLSMISTSVNDTVLMRRANEVKFATINADNIASDAITTAKILDGNVTAAKIANRTRKFLVQATPNSMTEAAQGGRGVALTNSAITYAYGRFYLPSDFVSDLTVTPVIVRSSATTGNIYRACTISYGANGASYTTHSSSQAAGAESLAGTASYIKEMTALTCADAAAGDYFSMYYSRDATDGLDTYEAVCYFHGFLVSYTADS